MYDLGMDWIYDLDGYVAFFNVWYLQPDIILISVFNVDKKIVKNYKRAVSLDSYFFS